MPVIGLEGFTAGSSVTILTDQGTVSAANSIASWGGSLAGIGIETRGAGVSVAPAAFWLKAVNASGFALSAPPPGTAYDPAFHEITYIWTVRGRPLAPFTAPQNLVSGWNDPNVMYGAEVAFVFPEPGTYTIDLWCIDQSGVTATAETNVTVGNPDAVYAGTRTLCLALDGDFTGKPAGALEYTSVASLISAIESASHPTRALLKRGETCPEFSVGREDNFEYLGAWGTGADPIVSPPRSGRLALLRDMTQFTVTGLDFRGGWDAATETGSSDDVAFFSRDNSASCWYHYHSCQFSGFEIFEPRPSNGTSPGAGTMMSNTTVTNWRDYGIFSNPLSTEAYFGLIGCAIVQNPDALNGGTKNGLYNNHGPVRLSNFTNVCIAQTDLFSRGGWSALFPDLADQPCIRLNSAPKAAGNRLTMDRIVCEGGFYQISLETQNGSTPEFDANYVLDKVLCIGTSKSLDRFVSLAVGGTTIRNLIGILPEVRRYHSQDWDGVIYLSEGMAVPSNLESPIQIYNSTAVVLQSAAEDDGTGELPLTFGDPGIFSNLTAENNVLYAPNLDTPVNADAPIDSATLLPGVTPRYKGVRFNFDHEEGTLATDLPTGSSFTLAYPAGTDQTYWQALQGIDTRHIIRGVGDALLAEEGDFDVTFGAAEITITNTSNRTWEAGNGWRLRLDRKSLIPAMDATYASPQALPLPRPLQSSAALTTGGLGRRAYDDFTGETRPQSGDARGALLPD